MPTLHRFDNCAIRMYAGDHLPPHFHIGMNDGRECLVEIATLQLLAGRVSRREIAGPLAWAQGNRRAAGVGAGKSHRAAQNLEGVE